MGNTGCGNTVWEHGEGEHGTEHGTGNKQATVRRHLSFELSRPPLPLFWGSSGDTDGTMIDLLLSRGLSGDL